MILAYTFLQARAWTGSSTHATPKPHAFRSSVRIVAATTTSHQEQQKERLQVRKKEKKKKKKCIQLEISLDSAAARENDTQRTFSQLLSLSLTAALAPRSNNIQVSLQPASDQSHTPYTRVVILSNIHRIHSASHRIALHEPSSAVDLMRRPSTNG